MSPSLWGRIQWKVKDQHWLLELAPGQGKHQCQETLRHEWAHAWAFEHGQRNRDDAHCSRWGVAYARCYRATEAA